MASMDLDTVSKQQVAQTALAQAAATAAAASAVAAAASAVVPAKTVALNATVGALPAGAITGAQFVTLISSNAVPGTQTTRTATAMVADAHSPEQPAAWTRRLARSA